MKGDWQKLRIFYKLKDIYMNNHVGSRKESSAEHTWSTLILADYFMDIMQEKLNRQRVYELLIYHDVVEIEANDTILDPANHVPKHVQQEKEMNAVKSIAQKLPNNSANKLLEAFNELEEEKTREAKFALAVDKLDAIIHEVDYKEDWKGWTEEFLRDKKEHYFKEFPEIHEAFEEMMIYFRKHGYFKQ